MAAPARASGPAPTWAPSPLRLPVEGALPEGLDGCFLQAFPHPLGDGRTLLSGVGLRGGEAFRHRARTTVPPASPFGPVPALAPAVRPANPGGRVPGPLSLARPVRDPATGRWHTVASYPGLGHAEHLVADSGGVVRHARPFALDGAPLMTAAALTGRHVVVFDLPVLHDRAAALAGTRPPYSWRPGARARVGLLSREGAPEPRWFEIGPCHVSRAVNAYEEDGRVVVDVVRHPRAYDGAPGPQGRPRLWRWTLDPATGAVEEREPAPGTETALADERVTGRAHRHVFGSRDPREGAALVRYDLATGGLREHRLGAGKRAGDPVFVPRGPGEADGWLLVFVRDDARREGGLLVFDALDLAAGPCAVVHVPCPPPAYGRAAWLPA
ncbi:carotenoid oxygenase family protein [Streptosporangium sp. NPDC001559]|uniref:carotenoid oxygenase family protein n=1 Tax=Streptosporangium sp. NPDC001559 TaxID=3366187 RepID=UPI0036E9DF1B